MKNNKLAMIIVLIITLFVGIDNIHAQICYYQTDDEYYLISYDSDGNKFSIDKKGNNATEEIGESNWQTRQTAFTWIFKEKLINSGEPYTDGKRRTGITVPAIPKGQCPEYIVYRYNASFLGSEGIFGFTTLSAAKTFAESSKEINKMSAWTLSSTTSKKYTETHEETKTRNTSGKNMTDSFGNKIEVNDSCELLGDKNKPDSIRGMIEEVLQYPRYIVPVLVIGLGTLDMVKAMAASKEDEMKKAQTTFIKRLILGVAFFLLPAIVNIILDLAETVWGFTACR